VAFVDTNVLLYSVSRDPAEQEKAARARTVLDRRDLTLSTQVLQEFYVQATRPSRSMALSHRDALGLVEAFGRFRIQAVTKAIVLAAIATRERFRISYWDAAIVEAARAAGSDVVLSEDLSDGADYGGVRVRNPFA
jgi:predicted nucleic acid-binding protein